MMKHPFRSSKEGRALRIFQVFSFLAWLPIPGLVNGQFNASLWFMGLAAACVFVACLEGVYQIVNKEAE